MVAEMVDDGKIVVETRCDDALVRVVEMIGLEIGVEGEFPVRRRLEGVLVPCDVFVVTVSRKVALDPAEVLFQPERGARSGNAPDEAEAFDKKSRDKK